MNYKLTLNENMIQKIEDNGTVRWVPNDPSNKDWMDYQEWLGQENEPLPADEQVEPQQ